jgi:hypothetical protein
MHRGEGGDSRRLLKSVVKNERMHRKKLGIRMNGSVK